MAIKKAIEGDLYDEKIDAIKIARNQVLNEYNVFNLSRSLIKNSELKFVSSMFKEKQFNDTVEGLTIFVDKKTENQIYKNIFIRDDSKVFSSVGTKSSTIFG